MGAGRDDLEIGAGAEQLRGAARGPGAHAGPAGQLVEGAAARGAERVAGVLPRGHAGQGDAGRGGRRQVLAGMDDDVHVPVQERLAHGGDEHARPADPGERARAVHVALRAHVHELHLAVRAGDEGLAHEPGLREGEGGGPGAEAKG